VSESAIGATESQSGSAPTSLKAALAELLGCGRELVADAADLVAAEAHVALQTMTALVVSAVCAAMLGVFAIAGVLAAIAMEMVARGYSAAAAAGAVAFACALAAAWFVLRLRALIRRALFERSRQHLRART
jgi:hypothetical protein